MLAISLTYSVFVTYQWKHLCYDLWMITDLKHTQFTEHTKTVP